MFTENSQGLVEAGAVEDWPSKRMVAYVMSFMRTGVGTEADGSGGN